MTDGEEARLPLLGEFNGCLGWGEGHRWDGIDGLPSHQSLFFSHIPGDPQFSQYEGHLIPRINISGSGLKPSDAVKIGESAGVDDHVEDLFRFVHRYHALPSMFPVVDEVHPFVYSIFIALNCPA